MPHSAYLLSTVVLAAAAAIHLQDMRSGMDRPHTTASSEESRSMAPSYRSPSPLQTIGNAEVRSAQQPQRWVF